MVILNSYVKFPEGIFWENKKKHIICLLGPSLSPQPLGQDNSLTTLTCFDTFPGPVNCQKWFVYPKMAIFMDHLQWIFPLNMVIFHSYVKLPEGNTAISIFYSWFVLECPKNPNPLALLSELKSFDHQDQSWQTSKLWVLIHKPLHLLKTSENGGQRIRNSRLSFIDMVLNRFDAGSVLGVILILLDLRHPIGTF